MADQTTEQAGLATRPQANEIIRMGMDTVQGFEALQRAANLLSASTIVPETYRRWTFNKDGDRIDNPSGLANCVVALNMASRMGADVIMITQNMHVIEGRPSWSSIFIIASINQCGRFSPLRFELSEPGPEVEVEYTYTEWGDDPSRPGKRKPTEKTGKIKVRHQTCRAWAIEKATGTRLNGPEVSIQMAIDEGWLQRKGSKWRTMQEIMLRYRSASLFGKLYAPELLMGLQSREELEDVFDVIDAETGEITQTRARVRDVTPRNAPGNPKALGEWELEQLEELEELIEKVCEAMRGAGFKDEAAEFEAKTRAERMKAKPEDLLARLRSDVEKLTAAPAPAASTEGDPEKLQAMKDADKPKDGELFPAESGKAKK